MPHFPTLRRLIYFFAAVVVFAVSVAAQAPVPSAVPIPMRDEGHHHLVFENSYVHVFLVEIPAHETTLLHHHDLPYISVPPGSAYAVPSPSRAAGAPSAPYTPRVGYSPGNFSHAVTNSSGAPLRNVAIELVRPQGAVRDRCAAILPNQPAETCEESSLTAVKPSKHTPLLETDEILVESWELGPGATITLTNDRLDLLVGGLTDVTVAGPPGIDSAHLIRGGLLWVPAGLKAVFTTSADRGGHFIAITFKDSAPASR
ncbi:MAG: hypothetical protein WB949_08640 [Candidatus Acidiferrales bacterium]